MARSDRGIWRCSDASKSQNNGPNNNAQQGYSDNGECTCRNPNIAVIVLVVVVVIHNIHDVHDILDVLPKTPSLYQIQEKEILS